MTRHGVVALALHLNKRDVIRRFDEPIRSDCRVTDELCCVLSIGNGSVMAVIEEFGRFKVCARRCRQVLTASVELTAFCDRLPREV